MVKYLLFGVWDEGGDGGLDDLIGEYDTLEEAKAAIDIYPFGHIAKLEGTLEKISVYKTSTHYGARWNINSQWLDIQ